jgi:hypothetical protein
MVIEKNDLCLNNMKVVLIDLASYQDSVGDEDLNPQGFDLLKRYEHFKLLCEKDEKKLCLQKRWTLTA